MEARNAADALIHATEKSLVELGGKTGAEDRSRVDEAIANNPSEVEAVKGGNEKLINFLVGQVMRRTGGRANPGLVDTLLRRALDAGR